MDISKEKLRVCMLLCFKMGKNATEATEMINSAQGDNSVGASTIRKWFLRFHVGNFNLQDNPRPGPEKSLKMKNFRLYSMKAHVKPNKNLKNNYGLLRLQFQIDCIQSERFTMKENGLLLLVQIDIVIFVLPKVLER